MAARYDHIDFTPPAGVRREANRALEWRKEFKRGGTAVGVARARDLGNGTQISPSTARRMHSYFSRHEVDKKGEGFSPGEPGFPSAGRIAWGLWGGDAGQAWASKLTRQMDAADKSKRSRIMEINEFLATRDCGTGAGGFKPGNKCGGEKGGDGAPDPSFDKDPPSGWKNHDGGKGSVEAYFGSGGKGPDGATHHGFVAFNKYGTEKSPAGWVAEVSKLGKNGGLSGGKAITKGGFKDRAKAIAWATVQAEAAASKKRSHAMQIERRSLLIEDTDAPLLTVERRCECDEDGNERDGEWIVGYAARFGVRSLDLGDFVERIDPAAFGLVSERRGRKTPLETRALFNHNPDYPLGRYPSTLKLFVDDKGLRYEFPVPDTSYGRDIASNIRAGIIKGSSFAFTIAKGGEDWTVEEGRSTRIVKKIDRLLDVGPVTFPAYPDADVGVARRSFEHHVAGRQSTSRLVIAKRQIADLREFLAKHGRKIW